MAEEPKKISFGFSKVSKKSNLIQRKEISESKNDIQYIDCLEEKSIKLVTGEEEKKKLPIIPMRNGNLLRESIKQVVKSRLVNEVGKDEASKGALTLDELAAREILEDLQNNKDKKVETPDITVPINIQSTLSGNEPSSLEDYDNMPISDFGLAMLRGMGWDPKKGIGLNEKVVTPLAPPVRPKGMGLGADKVPTSKNVSANGEILIMRKGAPVKIVAGPHINLYGKIEGFDELPGRLMVRIASNNTVISLNEIMVQLVTVSEFTKNVENSQKRSEKYIDSENQEQNPNRVKLVKRLNDVEAVELINSNEKKVSKLDEQNGNLEVKYDSKNSDNMESKEYSRQKKKSKKLKKHRTRSSDSNSSTQYHRNRGEKKKYNDSESRYKDEYNKNRKQRRRHSSSTSSSSHTRRKEKKSSRRGEKRYESDSSTDCDEDLVKHSRKEKNINRFHSYSSKSSSYSRIKHSKKSKKHHKR